MGATGVMAPQELFNTMSFPHWDFPFKENKGYHESGNKIQRGGLTKQAGIPDVSQSLKDGRYCCKNGKFNHHYTFTLKAADTNELPYFNAGQYLPSFVEIDGNTVERPYAIASSPEEAIQGFY